jgi:hypothetical protein
LNGGVLEERTIYSEANPNAKEQDRIAEGMLAN